MASPSGMDTECEHGLVYPIKDKNQLLGTAARRYIPAWDMLCCLRTRRVVKRAGWPGELSEPSAGARHCLMRALRREAYVDRIPRGQVWSPWWVGRYR